MAINGKVLVLLTAGVVIGSSLAACNRGEQDKSASNQDLAPMNQAPKQGYTGPVSPSTTPPPSSSSGAASSSSGDSQTGSPGSTNPSSSQQQPGTANQEQQPQQQK